MDCPVCGSDSRKLNTQYVGEDGNDGIDELYRCRRCFAKFEIWYSRGSAGVQTRVLGLHKYRWVLAAAMIAAVVTAAYLLYWPK
jgi:hypothetical protein